MTDVKSSNLRGFVCTKCRLLVSAIPEQIGDKVSCPGCRTVLKVAAKGEVYRPGPVKSEAQAMRAAESVQGVSLKYKEDWRKDLSVELLQERVKTLPWHMLVPAAAIGAVLYAGMMFMLWMTKPLPLAPNERALRALEIGDKVAQNESAMNEAKVSRFLTELYQADNIEELKPFLRDVPELDRKLKQYYPDGEVKLGTFSKLLSWRALGNEEERYLFKAKFGDQKDKFGVLMRNEQQNLCLDWESYVVYSGMPWNEIGEVKPQEPTVVRVIRKKVEYYNYGFNSKDWQSFELAHPEFDRVYIGYVKRDGLLMQQLLPIGKSESALEMVLDIRFPENSRSSRQVLIEKVRAEHWIEEHSE